jgi:hypothetical protein
VPHVPSLGHGFPPPHSIHALSEGLPRLRPDSPFETRLPTAHTSIPPCGRAYPALRKGTSRHAEGHVSRVLRRGTYPALRKSPYPVMRKDTYPVLRKGTRSRVPQEAGPKAQPLCRRLERSPKGEATDLLPLLLFPLFPPKKAHVKPPTHLTPSHPTTSACPMSYPPTATLDIDQKITANLLGFERNSLKIRILGVTHLL